MVVICLRIKEKGDGFVVQSDNLSREDATEREREYANYLEKMMSSVVNGEIGRKK